MNFFNTMVQAMGDRLKAKFDPNSATFGQGGIVGNINSAMHPQQGGSGNAFAQPVAQNLQDFTNMPNDGGTPGGTGLGGGLADQAAGVPAPGQQAANNTPNREAIARKMGFHSYDEMMAFQRNRNVQNGANPVVDGGTSAAGGSPMTNMQSAAQGASMLHPKNLFNYVLNMWHGATGGQ